MLDHIRHCFRDDVVRRRLDVVGQSAFEGGDLDRDRRAIGERPKSRVQPAVGEHRGMNAASDLTQLLERVSELVSGLSEDLARGLWIRELRLREPERHRQRDEALLRTVVKVALEPAPGPVFCCDDACARRLELLFVPFALRDVEAAADDPDDAAGIVEHGRAAPRDHAALALAIGEGVLVLSGRVPRRGGVEAGRHRVALALVDEDVPEIAAAYLLFVLVAGCDDGRGIEIADPALGIDREEQARRGVHDRRQEVVLRTQVSL